MVLVVLIVLNVVIDALDVDVVLCVVVISIGVVSLIFCPLFELFIIFRGSFWFLLGFVCFALRSWGQG